LILAAATVVALPEAAASAPAPDAVALAAPDISLTNQRAHLQQFQNIATANGGNRRSTTSGYTASVNYVFDRLSAAGFTVVRQACATGCTSGAGPNVIADWPGGDVNNTYMFGAHLDSVAAGPGINDNGSGTATVLELALTLAATNPTMQNHVRFAFWSDEEQGLNGSQHYANSLTATQRSQIRGYFNFDIDGGTTSIRSPAITLPTTGTLNVSMSWYLAHGSNSSNADFFRVSIVHNGGTTRLLNQAGAATNRNGAWATGTWNISAYAGQSVRILIQTADASTASLVEAGVDNVTITRA
jgi:hypothetical protein